jgi:2-oxoglutarate dehydrogenase complex dehydrogenase (E1) component-like enzyme
VTVCMFGDGASNTGNFGETMNLAALWKLPVVFLVENNLYGMGTSIERHSAVTDLSRKAEGFGVPGVRIDGMDVLAVRERVAEHIRIAREERRPTIVEAFTYRFRGHSAADPEVYREKEEVEEWRKKDPIASFAERLTSEDVLSEQDVKEIKQHADEVVMGAVEFADASEEPPLESLYENLYALPDERGETGGWYAVDERTPETHPGELEHAVGAEGEIRKLAEAGAAYAGQSQQGGRKRPEQRAEEDEPGPSDEAQDEEGSQGEGDEGEGDEGEGEPDDAE